jgi:hypothetical protein
MVRFLRLISEWLRDGAIVTLSRDRASTDNDRICRGWHTTRHVSKATSRAC